MSEPWQCDVVLEWETKGKPDGAVCVNPKPHDDDDRKHVWSQTAYHDSSQIAELRRSC